jgi:lysophospholipase L1-like esterase
MRDLTRPLIRKWLGRCLYLTYLVVVSAAIFEFGGRLIWVTDGDYLYPKSDQIFVFDERLNYKLKAGFSLAGERNRLYPGIGIRVNRLHMRGAQPDEREAVFLVGDSVPFGFAVRESESMAARLERHLAGRYQVLNAGTPGYNMEQIALRTREVVKQAKPAIVILLVNANDGEARYFMHYAGLTVKRFRTYPWERDQYPPNFPPEVELKHDPTARWLLPTLLRLFKGESPVRTQLSRYAPKTEEDVARHLAHEARQVAFWNSGHPEATERTQRAVSVCKSLVKDLTVAGIRVIVGRFPWSVTVLKLEVEDDLRSLWINALEPSPSVKVVDLWHHLLEAQKREPQFLLADGHPNAAGHNTIALALKSAVVESEVSTSARGSALNP